MRVPCLLVVALVVAVGAIYPFDQGERLWKNAYSSFDKKLKQSAFERLVSGRGKLGTVVKGLETALKLYKLTSKPLTGQVVVKFLCDNSLELRIVRLFYPPLDTHLEAAAQTIIDHISQKSPLTLRTAILRAFDTLLLQLAPPQTSLARPPHNPFSSPLNL